MSEGDGQPNKPHPLYSMGCGGGNAALRIGWVCHTLIHYALWGCLLVAVGLSVLAIRLAQGPLEVEWLARRITENAAGRVSVGRAALVWEGLQGGLDRPFNLELSNVVVADAAGMPLANVPRAEVSIDLLALVEARLALDAVALEGLSLTLHRDADGGWNMQSAAASSATPMDVHGLLSLLVAKPGGEGNATVTLLSELRRVRLHHAAIMVDDRSLALTWALPQIDVDLTRGEAGGLVGSVSAVLAMGAHDLHAFAQINVPASVAGGHVMVQLSAFNPSEWSKLTPVFAPLATVDTPLLLSGTMELSDGPSFAHATVALHAGAGQVAVGTGALPIRAADALAQITPETVDFTLQDLRLQARDVAPPTHVTAHVTAQRLKDGVAAQATVAIDQVAFVDLPALWPEGTGGPGTRPWIVKNLTSGSARDAHVALSLTAPEDFSDATLLSLSGGLEGVDVTGHWMRPVPPLEHGTAHVVFVDPDTLDVLIDNGTQARTHLGLKPSKVHITGLAAHDQFIAIAANIAGPFADLVGVLKHPTLHLLDRQPFKLGDPAGNVSGVLTVNMPLKTDLKLSDVAIHGAGKLSDGHLGGSVAGHDIDQANLDFDVGNDGLKLGGTGAISAIPVALKLAMDFRPGPAREILQQASVSGAVSAKQLEEAGLPPNGRLSGLLGVQLNYLSRRDASGELTVAADLSKAGVSLLPSTWRKPEGVAGKAGVRLVLQADKISRIDQITADAPGLQLNASADVANGAPDVLRIKRLVLGDGTDITGELRLPNAARPVYVAQLSGPKLDMSWFFRHSSSNAAVDEPEKRGPAYSLQGQFGHVLMANGAAFEALTADVENDGWITSRAQMNAKTAQGEVSLAITPQAHGRVLRVQSNDAGTLLRAFDVTETMQGGVLAVNGVYDDSNAAHVLKGSTEITDFRIAHAPTMARLLQAMSLYGLVELTQGPGLGFIKLVGPFEMGRQNLTLTDLRAYSASLGLTAKGQINLARRTLNVEGTVIPAYFFNSLLGRVPFLGRLFSPEAGGGVLAAAYSIHGAIDDPQVSVNPLAALTPGFLRGFFDIFTTPPAAVDQKPTAPP